MLGYLFGKASDLNSFAGESNSPVLIGMDVSHDVLWSVLRGGSHRRRPHGDNPVCSPFRRGGLVRKSPRRCVPPLSSISFALWPRIGEAAHPGPYSVGGASSSLGAAAFTPPPQCPGEEEQTINEGPPDHSQRGCSRPSQSPLGTEWHPSGTCVQTFGQEAEQVLTSERWPILVICRDVK